MYLAQVRAPIAPNPDPATTTFYSLETLYFRKMSSRLDFMIFVPRKNRSLPLYLVGLAA